MLVKVDNKEELHAINYTHTIISSDVIEHDLEINPFGYYLLEIENDKIIGFLYYSDIYERAEINQIEV